MEWIPDPQPDANSGWGEGYLGCYKDAGHPVLPTDVSYGGTSTHPGLFPMSDDQMSTPTESCSAHCAGYRYFGLQWSTGCTCGNTFGGDGVEPTGCADCAVSTSCSGRNAVYGRAAWQLAAPFGGQSEPEGRSTCWETLPALVPNSNTLSDTGGGTASSQGASYFTERFCPGWAKFVSSNSCLDSDPGCDASGSAIFDGGQDMVNIFLFRFYFDFLIAFLIKTPENTHCCVHSMISAISCPAASWNLADMLALCLR